MSSKRRSGLRPLAGRLAGITASAFAKRGIAEAGVITDWVHIVGPELARRTAPLRLAFVRGARTDGTLHVRVAGAAALEVQHSEPQIVERVNGYFGYRAVARLSLVQGPVTAPAKKAGRGKEKPLPPGGEEALRTALADIPEGPMREALLRLGRSVSRRTGPKAATNRGKVDPGNNSEGTA